MHRPRRRRARRRHRQRPRTHRHRRRRRRVLRERPCARRARHRQHDRHPHRNAQREQQPQHPHVHIPPIDLPRGEAVQEEDQRGVPGAVRLRVHGRDEENDAPRPLEDDLGEEREREEEALAVLRARDLALVSARRRELLDGGGDHAVLVGVGVAAGVEHVVREAFGVVLLWGEAPDGEGGRDGEGADAGERREAVEGGGQRPNGGCGCGR